jgi:putative salt-induced outer membrane protein YdiY
VVFTCARSARRRAARAALWIWALTGLAAAPISAGEVSVQGEVLEGKVAGVTAEGVQFETIYGKGAILIPYASIERLESDASFVVLYGDTGEAHGRLLEVSGDELLVGDDPETAVRVATGEIFRSFGKEEFEASGIEALRSRYRYWKGNFDFGFAATQATTDTTSVDVGLQVERRKAPTRLLLRGRYRYSVQEKQDEPSDTVENDVRGLLRGEYNVTQRLFVYGSATAEYDEIASLSIRTVPKGGAGYRFWQSTKGFLSGDVGFAYVYQRYFGGDTEDYPAVSFGSELEYLLPYSMKFTALGEYLPSVEDWTGNYLLRGTAALAVPMLSWMDLKLTVFDEYNNRPAADTKRNRLTFTAGLSLVF